MRGAQPARGTRYGAHNTELALFVTNPFDQYRDAWGRGGRTAPDLAST